LAQRARAGQSSRSTT